MQSFSLAISLSFRLLCIFLYDRGLKTRSYKQKLSYFRLTLDFKGWWMQIPLKRTQEKSGNKKIWLVLKFRHMMMMGKLLKPAATTFFFVHHHHDNILVKEISARGTYTSRTIPVRLLCCPSPPSLPATNWSGAFSGGICTAIHLLLTGCCKEVVDTHLYRPSFCHNRN